MVEQVEAQEEAQVEAQEEQVVPEQDTKNAKAARVITKFWHELGFKNVHAQAYKGRGIISVGLLNGLPVGGITWDEMKTIQAKTRVAMDKWIMSQKVTPHE